MIFKTISTILLGLIFGFQATNIASPSTAPLPSTADFLTLTLSCHYLGSLGWGDTFKCHVDQVTQGSLDETSIILGIPAGAYDGDRLASIGIDSGAVYGAEKKSVSFLTHLKKVEIDRDHGLLYRNGFVDKEGNIWELTDIEPHN